MLNESVLLRTPHSNINESYVEVVQNGIRYRSNDFVVVMADPNGDHHMVRDTDELTLGVAAQLIEEEYEEALVSLGKEDAARVIKAVADVKIDGTLERLKAEDAMLAKNHPAAQLQGIIRDLLTLFVDLEDCIDEED